MSDERCGGKRLAPDVSSLANKLTVLSGVLEDGTFARLKQRALAFGEGERVNLPVHKRGATVGYRTLQGVAPEAVEIYQSPSFHTLVSGIVRDTVRPTPENDQSSCSLLVYDRPGDHIGWHYDLNFYNGRHFTAILSLLNQGAAGAALSSAQLTVQTPNGPSVVPTPANTLVIFEGAYVFHCVSPLGPGQKRIVLSMTFCTDSGTTRAKSAARRVKDAAYFGVRSLWT